MTERNYGNRASIHRRREAAARVLMDFYRCELHNTCHFYASDEFVKFMQRVFAGAGIELVVNELQKGQFPPDQAHKVLEVFTAIPRSAGAQVGTGPLADRSDRKPGCQVCGVEMIKLLGSS